MTPVQIEKIISEAESWLGTPYHHEADLKGIGVDCIMLLCKVYYAAGIVPAIDPRPYIHDWHLHHSDELYLGGLEQYASHCDAAEAGDIGVWKFGRCYSHGGIFVGPETVIHSYMGLGVVKSQLGEEPLAHRNFRLYRVNK